jgi:DNA-binding GntR family transcriptional regulator
VSSQPINATTDPRGVEPLFAEVARALRSEMASGRLRAGQRLAPERELSVRIGVSRNTLRRALLQLEQKGLVTAAGRHGWYVAAAPVVEDDRGPSGLTGWAAQAGVALTSRVLHQRLRRATAEERDALRLEPRGRVFELERVRVVDGDPLSLDRSCLPGRLADALEGVDFGSASLYDVLAERCGLVPGARECTLRAAVADARTAGELGIPAGAPLLVVQEAVLDQHGDPLEFAVLANRGDRWRYRTTQLVREVEV